MQLDEKQNNELLQTPGYSFVSNNFLARILNNCLDSSSSLQKPPYIPFNLLIEH